MKTETTYSKHYPIAVRCGSLEVNPSVERKCLKDGQKQSILHGIVGKRVIGHFC
jgi:hypothetical protein